MSNPPAPSRNLSDSEADLSVVERWFQAVITHPGGVAPGLESSVAQEFVPISRSELEQMITRSTKLSAHDRLSVYANAYYARLIECLGESFPVLKRTLGTELFNGFAFGYLQRYPSRSYTLGSLGDQFVRYLDETRPDGDGDASPTGGEHSPGWPDFLIDLARLEWTIDEVFDGPGVERKGTLRAEDLLRFPREDWPDVRLRVAPCLRLLFLRYPVSRYYTEVRKSEEDAKIRAPLPAESFVAVTRQDFVVRRYELSRPEYELLVALQQDVLRDAIARAASACDWDDDVLAEQLNRWFRLWTERQFFEGVE